MQVAALPRQGTATIDNALLCSQAGRRGNEGEGGRLQGVMA